MRFIYVWVILLLGVSCTSKKRLIVQTDQKVELLEQKNVYESEIINRDSCLLKRQKIITDEGREIGVESTSETIIYDTSKPIDNVTGRPPVFQETRITIKRKLVNKINTAHNSTEKVNISKQTIQEKKDSSVSYLIEDNSLLVKKKEKKNFLKIPWLWIISGAFLVIVICYCIRGRINPFRYIWRKLR